MIKKFINDYLTFTRGERYAVIGLSISLSIIFSLPFFIRPSKEKVNEKELDGFVRVLAHLKGADNEENKKPLHYDATRNEWTHKPIETGEKEHVARLFRFDPNTLSAEGWRSLGLKEKTISIIQHYLEKGGQFRHAEDLGKIYGLSPDLAKKLMPYVTIVSKEKLVSALRFQRSDTTNHYPRKPALPRGITDVSVADSQTLVMLPGIGNRLASRIINFRDKLGGFYSVAQLGETFGLPDSTFQKLKPFLSASGNHLRKININTAPADLLKTHPYLRWNIANAIVSYRNEHGDFKELQDLNKIALITPDLFEKISPYLER